jgi:hypothetical protein
MRVTVPAFKWLYSQEEGEGEEAKKGPLVNQEVDVQLSLNNQEWINALSFSYFDAEINRISYAN